MGVACALSLVSCKDKGAEEWNNKDKEQATVAPETASPAADSTAAMQKELLNYMIFNVGKQAGAHVTNPAWYEEVRDMRNKLDEYYQTLEGATGDDLKTRMQLGIMLGDITHGMRVDEKALKFYADTLKEWEALPEEERKSIAGRRMRSAIANGMGACTLQQGKAMEALPFYELALEIDQTIFNELAPADNGPLPLNDISPDLTRAAEDILSSYRCLGECQLRAEDPEEARDTYKKGQELAMRMNHLPPSVALQFIRLRSAQGDLENSCGQLKNAVQAWAQAVKLGQDLMKSASQPSVRLQIVQNQRKLETLLKAVLPKLQAEQEAARAAEQAAEQAAEAAKE